MILSTKAPYLYYATLSHHCLHPRLTSDLALTLSLSLSLFSSLSSLSSLSHPHLHITLSIPFLGHCILTSLVPVPLISILIPIYHLYSSFHLRPRSRPLPSSFVLISTYSLILYLVLSVFFSHHRHPSPGSLMSPYLCLLSCTYTAWSVPSPPLVPIPSHTCNIVSILILCNYQYP